MAPHRLSKGPRMAMHATWIAIVAALGLALSTSLPGARALGLPTITLPGITTVPLPDLTTTTGDTTPATTSPDSPPSSPPAPSSPTEPTAPAAASDETTVVGAIRLSGGLVSIPVSSVRLPARLRVLLSFAPKTIDRETQPISARARIVDTRGYVVRGARVLVEAGRVGALRGAGTRLSAVDGLVAFVVRNHVALGRAASLVLLVQASDPNAPRAATASQRVQIRLRASR